MTCMSHCIVQADNSSSEVKWQAGWVELGEDTWKVDTSHQDKRQGAMFVSKSLQFATRQLSLQCSLKSSVRGYSELGTRNRSTVNSTRLVYSLVSNKNTCHSSHMYIIHTVCTVFSQHVDSVVIVKSLATLLTESFTSYCAEHAYSLPTLLVVPWVCTLVHLIIIYPWHRPEQRRHTHRLIKLTDQEILNCLCVLVCAWAPVCWSLCVLQEFMGWCHSYAALPSRDLWRSHLRFLRPVKKNPGRGHQRHGETTSFMAQTHLCWCDDVPGSTFLFCWYSRILYSIKK